jgi:sugar transferase (PEP-CTERM/EpsH1 system associated)
LAPRFEIDLVSLVHDKEEASHARDLDDLGIRTTVAAVPHLANKVRGLLSLAGPTPLTHSLLASPDVLPALRDIVTYRPPDVVFAYCSSMARYALEAPLAAYPLVIDMIDADSAKWRALADRSAPPRRWIYAREHRTLSAFERQAVCRATTTLVVNERERAILHALAPNAAICMVPNGVDTDAFRPVRGPSEAPVAVFCGMMDYGPNETAALWTAREVWPRVLEIRPDARLLIVGARPTPAVKALASSSITVTGEVPDTRPYLWDASVGLAPLQIARGIQNKALEAIAAGLPTVVTPAVAEGLPAEASAAIFVAGSAEAFAREVLQLFSLGPRDRRLIAERADLVPLAWATRLRSVTHILEDAARAPSK